MAAASAGLACGRTPFVAERRERAERTATGFAQTQKIVGVLKKACAAVGYIMYYVELEEEGRLTAGGRRDSSRRAGDRGC